MLNDLTLQDALNGFYTYNDRVFLNDGEVIGIEMDFVTDLPRMEEE